MTGLNGVNGRTEEIPSGTRQQDMSKSLPEEPRGGQVHNGTKEDMAVRGEPRPHMPASNGRDQQSLQFYSNPSFFPPSNNYYPPGPSSYLPAQTLFPTGHQQQQQATNIPVKTEETLIKGSALPTMTMETPSLQGCTLVVRQQPLRARMCGCGDKDRRAVDPPPVVQLVLTKTEKALHSRQAEELFHNSRLLLHVSLWTEDKESRIDSNSKIPYRLPIIIGTRAVTPSLLADESGDQGLYFVFQDLSIRVEGVFCLQFSLVDLQRNTVPPPVQSIHSSAQTLHTVLKSHVMSSIFSEPFTVFTARSFPGMSDSSPLLKLFAAQGYKIAIRKERMRGPLSAGSNFDNEFPVQDDETSLPQPTSLEAGDDELDEDEEDETSMLQPIPTTAPLPSTTINPSSKRMRL